MKKLSPIWIIPIITAFIGLWIVFYYVTTQGTVITLVTNNAEGIVGGKTAIKSRSVDVGIVESVSLSEDLSQVVITARLHRNMDRLLNNETVFWIVKPQIGRDGVSGLGTLLSGVYIELLPGKSQEEQRTFSILESPPLSSPDARGLRIVLESKQSGVLAAGDPVLFRGMRVGTIESHHFDTEQRLMRYQLFINAPFDVLVTNNVRFWKDSGFALDMSAQGVKLEMGSLQTLISGGISFDVPEGWPMGEPAVNESVYELYSDKSRIQDSLYTRHENFIILFKDSIRGLNAGAPVEFRGIRIGTVVEAPHYISGMWNMSKTGFFIPVLIRIEPDRIRDNFGPEDGFANRLIAAQSKGLRASLKSGNLLTGSLYVEFDFYDNPDPWIKPPLSYDYPVLASVSGGLSQIQHKVMQALDKINALPIEPVMDEMTATLQESQKAIKNMNQAITQLDKLLSDKNTQGLPKDLKNSLNELNKTLKGLQPGSAAYNKLVDDMQRLDDVLREIQPVVRTLNDKSNALVFEAPQSSDPQPKRSRR